ncbi:MAG: hemerythrin domain-containing protein [Alphaproteobacteria bacterium]|nr:hemerythrin domain-containing protein [Alphaproteobacteria bacterium]
MAEVVTEDAVDIPEFIDAMRQRHAELVREARLLRRTAADTGFDPAATGVLEALSDAIIFHVQREERFLFPSILAVVADDDEGVFSARGTMATMELEHEELAVLQHRLRDLLPVDDELSARIVVFLDAFEAHNDAEDAQLFPAVKDVLDARDGMRRRLRVVAK